MKTRRWFSIAMALIMVMGLLPVGMIAADEPTGIYYSAAPNDASMGSVSVAAMTGISLDPNEEDLETTIGNEGTVPSGTTLKLIATPAEGFWFEKWVYGADNEESYANPFKKTVTENTTFRAVFKKAVGVTYSAAPNDASMGSVSVSINGTAADNSGTVSPGTTLKLSATAKPGFEFVKWRYWANGENTATESTFEKEVTANTTFEAVFRKADDVTYSAAPIDASMGSVSVSINGTAADNSGTVPSATTLTLSATAVEGFLFEKWVYGANEESYDNPFTKTVTANTTFTAVFDENWNSDIEPVDDMTRHYSVKSNNGNWGSVDAWQGDEYMENSDSVVKGTKMTFNAYPKENHWFMGWTGGEGLETPLNDSNPLVVEVNEDVSYIAYFAPEIALPASAVLIKGETLNLSGFVPEGLDSFVSWESTNHDAASVDKTGRITAEDFGYATIELKIANRTFRCAVSVVPQPTSFILNPTKITMGVNENAMLTYEIEPDECWQLVQFTSSDPDVVTVDDYGSLHSEKQGKAVITATAGSLSATCEVTVDPNAHKHHWEYARGSDGNYVVKWNANEAGEYVSVDVTLCCLNDPSERPTINLPVTNTYREEPTLEQEGFIEYFSGITEVPDYKTRYKKYFDDGLHTDFGVGKTVILDKLSLYYFAEGADQKVVITKDAKFTIKRRTDDAKTFDLFESVKLNGVPLASSEFVAEEGSVKLTLPSATLKKAGTGDHTIEVTFQDGAVSTGFTIRAAENPTPTPGNTSDPTAKPGDPTPTPGGSGSTTPDPSNPTATPDPSGGTTAKPTAKPSGNNPRTGDEGHALLWIGLTAVCAVGLLGLLVANRKRFGVK